MIRNYVGDKKSIEARSDDGRIWTGTFFDRGHTTTFTDATEKELNDLAREKGVKLTPTTKR